MFVRVHTEEEVYDLWDAGWLYGRDLDPNGGYVTYAIPRPEGIHATKDSKIDSWKRYGLLRNRVFGYVTED